MLTNQFWSDYFCSGIFSSFLLDIFFLPNYFLLLSLSSTPCYWVQTTRAALTSPVWQELALMGHQSLPGQFLPVVFCCWQPFISEERYLFQWHIYYVSWLLSLDKLCRQNMSIHLFDCSQWLIMRNWRLLMRWTDLSIHTCLGFARALQCPFVARTVMQQFSLAQS